MDLAPLVLIMAPILLPVVTKFGMSPIQFGVMMMLNLGIGLCTPPVGTALFTGCAIGNMKIEKSFKGHAAVVYSHAHHITACDLHSGADNDAA